MENKTLEQILKSEETQRHDDGSFGIKACKEHILWEVRVLKKSLYQLLEEFVEKANKDIFFNRAMILACWELIN